MKNKKLLIIILVLLLLGVGAYFFGQSQKSQTANQGANSKDNMQTEKKSLSDFLTMTQSVQCTFSDKTTNNSGSVYAGNSKMRGDFQSDMGGKQMQSHMINDGSYVYFWSDDRNEGYKMSLDVLKKQETESNDTKEASSMPPQAEEMQKQADYSCKSWDVDATKFALPQGVNFSDFSEMMHGIPQGGSSAPVMQNNQAACSQCEEIPAGASRDRCKALLKCN